MAADRDEHIDRREPKCARLGLYWAGRKLAAGKTLQIADTLRGRIEASSIADWRQRRDLEVFFGGGGYGDLEGNKHSPVRRCRAVRCRRTGGASGQKFSRQPVHDPLPAAAPSLWEDCRRHGGPPGNWRAYRQHDLAAHAAAPINPVSVEGAADDRRAAAVFQRLVDLLYAYQALVIGDRFGAQ